MTDRTLPSDADAQRRNTRKTRDIRGLRVVAPRIALVETDGGEYLVDGEHCSCGHQNTFVPSRTEGFESTYRKRRAGACPHQRAVLDARDFGPCATCEGWLYVERRLEHHGRHVLSQYRCATCDTVLAVG